VRDVTFDIRATSAIDQPMAVFPSDLTWTGPSGPPRRR
jgi:hypothetical protein